MVPPVEGTLATGMLNVERDALGLTTQQFLYREDHKPDSPMDVNTSRGQASSGLRLLMINIDHFEKYRAGGDSAMP
jgi:hypothetical protein